MSESFGHPPPNLSQIKIIDRTHKTWKKKLLKEKCSSEHGNISRQYILVVVPEFRRQVETSIEKWWKIHNSRNQKALVIHSSHKNYRSRWEDLKNKYSSEHGNISRQYILVVVPEFRRQVERSVENSGVPPLAGSLGASSRGTRRRGRLSLVEAPPFTVH